MPFHGSRRLTGSNLFFDATGAVLETDDVEIEEALLDGWRSRVLRARAALKWPASRAAAETVSPARSVRSVRRATPLAVRRHANGASLALAAPPDQLFTAAEVNEWAWCAALAACDPDRWAQVELALITAALKSAEAAADWAATPDGRPPLAIAFAATPPVLEDDAALARFAKLSSLEARPPLRALIEAADARGLSHALDDDLLTLGSGASGRTWSIAALPEVAAAPWSVLSDARVALVTGSNGKTTTVRLLAACARAQGWREGYNCTDGLFVAGEQIASGDYSGPVGARTILRDARVDAAILETARGGILRRGLAVQRAQTAIVTNVSADHFGEYGIDDLAALTEVKLVVASALDAIGVLVLNADDPSLHERAGELDCPVAWFSQDYANAVLAGHRAAGGAVCGVRAGRLIAHWPTRRGASDNAEHDLGAIQAMPLTVEGAADYNVSNIAGAALGALALGVAPDRIADVLTHFGAHPIDNPGRLMRYDYRGARVLIDYAHNPEGLTGLLKVAMHLPRTGRLALLLGQAGNRTDEDIEHLAAAAARFHPDLIVIKEMEGYLRGRAPGEVPRILRDALMRAGVAGAVIEIQSSELAAVKRVLEWSRRGDVLVLPVHDRTAREEAIALLT